MNLESSVYRASPIRPSPGMSTAPVDFVSAVDSVSHVDDPEGQGRRYFEGWASMPGLDMQDMEIVSHACEKGAHAYLARNPVIVWHHKADMPIGKVLSLTFSDKGMYMTGEIFNMQDILDRWREFGRRIPLDSIALKCEEVWDGIKNGRFRGLSIRGRVREVVPVYSAELDKDIPRILDVELYEISVTPISIHPTTQIVKINTVAKAFGEALEICKALDFQPQQPDRGDAMSQVQERWEAFQAAVREAAGENGTVELPEDVSKGLAEYAGNIEKTPEEMMAEQAAVIKSLQDQLEQAGQQRVPAARRGFISHTTPDGARVKPTGADVSGINLIEKGLTDASTTFRGKTDFGEGDRFGLLPSDVYKLALLDASTQGFMSLMDGVTLSERGQKWARSQNA